MPLTMRAHTRPELIARIAEKEIRSEFERTPRAGRDAPSPGNCRRALLQEGLIDHPVLDITPTQETKPADAKTPQIPTDQNRARLRSAQ
jgi:hypothetical protein